MPKLEKAERFFLLAANDLCPMPGDGAAPRLFVEAVHKDLAAGDSWSGTIDGLSGDVELDDEAATRIIRRAEQCLASSAVGVPLGRAIRAAAERLAAELGSGDEAKPMVQSEGADTESDGESATD